MRRTFGILAVTWIAFTLGCLSMNRVLPSEADAKAIEADVRGRIADTVPEKTFAVEVEVEDHAVVILSGYAPSRAMADRIADAAREVSGVRKVVNNIQVKP